MEWLKLRRNQLLVGGSVGALAGGALAYLLGLQQVLVSVFFGFALGKIIAVLALPRSK